MSTNEIKVISPSSREITCFQTIYSYALAACRDDSDIEILKACAKPIEKILVQEAEKHLLPTNNISNNKHKY
jgi:hypothetical protein